MRLLLTVMMVFCGMRLVDAKELPIELTQPFKITQIIPTQGATAKSCEMYAPLKNRTLVVSFPAELHPASVYSILIDGHSVKMFTDNGWGDPYYLYGSDLTLQGLPIREVFIEFHDHTYSHVTQLIMRANPQGNGAAASIQNCRMIGEPE